MNIQSIGFFSLILCFVPERISAVSTVYAGKGWENNVTIYAVKEKVTWYSAKEANNCEIGRGLISRGSLLKTFAENTQASDNLNDSIIWIGAIKLENDGQLYNSDTCELIDLNHINLPKVPGKRECVFLNISVKTALFGYEDCMALHPYLCISVNEFVEPVVIENVTVQSYSDQDVEMIQTHGTEDWESCTALCTRAMNCIAALFSWTDINCFLYFDLVSGEFENKHELLILNVTQTTKLYLTSWKRVFFEMIEIGGIYPLLNDRNFKCFDNSTETTTELVPMTTTTLECTCTLNDCKSFKNSTEILEMIKEIKKNLYIDKQQLSSTKRRLISAEDPRTSSQSIGLFGVAILTSVILAIVVADVPRLISFFRNSSINKIHDHLES